MDISGQEFGVVGIVTLFLLRVYSQTIRHNRRTLETIKNDADRRTEAALDELEKRFEQFAERTEKRLDRHSIVREVVEEPFRSGTATDEEKAARKRAIERINRRRRRKLAEQRDKPAE